MSACEDCGRHHFDYGDRVRLVQNPEVKGQIIGERDWETQYLVRFAIGMVSDYVEAVEIEPDPDHEPPTEASAPVPTGDGSNVIYANFGAHTETMGAA